MSSLLPPLSYHVLNLAYGAWKRHLDEFRQGMEVPAMKNLAADTVPAGPLFLFPPSNQSRQIMDQRFRFEDTSSLLILLKRPLLFLKSRLQSLASIQLRI